MSAPPGLGGADMLYLAAGGAEGVVRCWHLQLSTLARHAFVVR